MGVLLDPKPTKNKTFFSSLAKEIVSVYFHYTRKEIQLWKYRRDFFFTVAANLEDELWDQVGTINKKQSQNLMQVSL
jgi:hypothetical protein